MATQVIIHNHFPVVTAKIEMAAKQIVEAAAYAVESGAKQRAPVDTGNLRGSIGASPAGGGSWHIVASAGYSLYVEMGTRYMSARPFMIPAFELAVSRMRIALSRIASFA